MAAARMARTSGKLLLVYAKTRHSAPNSPQHYRDSPNVRSIATRTRDLSDRSRPRAYVHLGTASAAAGRYAFMMQPKYMKATVSIGWVSALAAVAFFGNFTASALMLVAVLAVLAPLVVMWFWRPPVQTTSQRMQDVLR